ncbi:MAG: N-acetyl sugar amidotransferase [Phycisphaerales bacterium]|nr:N-acetyl sugar amidotransferase [Phycisphaerales bacterium]MCH2153677.1 N-acetyl sugar amidotransferase [Phycisphaerales bacterium]
MAKQDDVHHGRGEDGESSLSLCSRCVTPVTAESLAFDSDGACSVCKQIDYKRESIDWTERREQLDELINRYRGKYDHDCIVPFSGGKDSTFTLWYIVKELKLKPLVVRFNHGFFRPQLRENCELAFRRLGVDVLEFTPNWQVVRKLMYESLVRRGDFCWHCHTGIFSYPMRVALQQQVPLVVWGEPTSEYSSFYSYDEEELADERRFNRVVNLGINAEDMLGMMDDTISDYPVDLRDLKPFTYPPTSELRKARVSSVFLGYYIPWDVRKQTEIIQDELDWKGDVVEGVPPGYEYEKIECYMQGVRDYIKYLKRGYGRTSHLVSIDIRNGRIDRDRGLELMQAYDGKRPPSLDLFLDILGISEARFMEIVGRHVVDPHCMPDADSIESMDVKLDGMDDFRGVVCPDSPRAASE